MFIHTASAQRLNLKYNLKEIPHIILGISCLISDVDLENSIKARRFMQWVISESRNVFVRGPHELIHNSSRPDILRDVIFS